MAHEDITIDNLVAELLKAKYWILLAAVVFAAGGLAVGLLGVRQYDASIVLSPISDSGSGTGTGGLASLVSRYSDIAAIAGINVQSGNGRQEAVAVLQSELLTERYIRENNLLPLLYASKWDKGAGTWKSGLTKRPTVWEGAQLFKKKIRSVNDDRRTGLVSLTIRWQDPIKAAQWANGFVDLTNSYLRDRAIEEAERNIKYLHEQEAKTNVVELKQAIYSLLQQELNTEMVANGRLEYALKVVDPAIAPEKPSTAAPWQIALAAGLGGLFLAGLAVAGRRMISTNDGDQMRSV